MVKPLDVRQDEFARELVSDFGADYADAFASDRDVSGPVGEVARRCLQAADAAGGVFGRLVWGGVLGFRLERGPGTFVGWRISTDEPTRFVLDADGRLMAGRLVFAARPGTVTWVTMLRFHSRAAAPVWAAAGPVHRTLATRVLARAVTP